MRVGIVNDSAIAREALRRVVSAAGHTIAWIVNDGIEAVATCKGDRPDVVLMDLRMPVMDGVECTRRIMADSPCPILLVTATVDGNTSLVYDAMSAGALDAVNTPILGSNNELVGAQALLDKIERIGKLSGHRARTANEFTVSPRTRTGDLPALIVIGSSTGGPDALAKVLVGMPPGIAAAIVIVQHVDAAFAPGLAEWLEVRANIPTSVIRDGDVPKPGTVHVAATDDHLVLTASRRFAYTPEPRRANFRPSVDVFFDSVVEHWPRAGSAALLTGMGADGARGLLALRGAGWHTIAQDEATSVVYGMPRAAAQMKAAVEVLPIGSIGARLAIKSSGK